MASFNGCCIVGPTPSSHQSGGVFYLNKGSSEDLRWDDGVWTVESKAGSSVVIVRGGWASSYQQARADSLSAAQRGLDAFCLFGFAPLSIRDAETQHIAWWIESKALALRVVAISEISMKMSLNFEVTDSSGKTVAPAPTTPVAWHESFRYFRLSQSTDDTFDAFRNLYLALESILDNLAPVQIGKNGRPAERESAWTRRALTMAAGLTDLSRFARAAVADPVEDLANEMRDIRNAVFHAKSGTKKILLPHESSSRSALSVLERFGTLYVELANRVLKVRRPTAMLLPPAFDSITDGLGRSLEYFVSDDETPCKREDTSPNPAGGQLVRLTPSSTPEQKLPFLRSYVATSPAAALSSLSFIRRLGSTAEGVLFSCADLEGKLELSGVDRFEVELGIRASNTQAVKTVYTM